MLSTAPLSAHVPSVHVLRPPADLADEPWAFLMTKLRLLKVQQAGSGPAPRPQEAAHQSSAENS